MVATISTSMPNLVLVFQKCTNVAYLGAKAPFTLYNLTGLGTVPSPVWCNVNASDRARPTQMSCGPGPPRGGGLGPDRRGSARYDL